MDIKIYVFKIKRKGKEYKIALEKPDAILAKKMVLERCNDINGTVDCIYMEEYILNQVVE